MKVYLEHSRNHTVMVTPGAQHTDVSDWKDDKGNPRRFDIKFENGMATVDTKMGNYLIENGYANRTRLIRVRNQIATALNG